MTGVAEIICSADSIAENKKDYHAVSKYGKSGIVPLFLQPENLWNGIAESGSTLATAAGNAESLEYPKRFYGMTDLVETICSADSIAENKKDYHAVSKHGKSGIAPLFLQPENLWNGIAELGDAVATVAGNAELLEHPK